MASTVAASIDSIVSGNFEHQRNWRQHSGLNRGLRKQKQMGEAKRRKLLDPTFGENKKIEYRDADGFVTQKVVDFAQKKLLKEGRGIVILGDRLGYMPLAKLRNQSKAYSLVSTYDTTVFILSVTPPKTQICLESIRGEMERRTEKHGRQTFNAEPQ